MQKYDERTNDLAELSSKILGELTPRIQQQVSLLARPVCKDLDELGAVVGTIYIGMVQMLTELGLSRKELYALVDDTLERKANKPK